MEGERHEPIAPRRPRSRAADWRARSAQPAAEPRAERQAADEHHEHQRLRIGRVAEEELHVVRPDRLVDQPAEAGQHERQRYSASRAPKRVDVGGAAVSWDETNEVKRDESRDEKGGSLSDPPRVVRKIR